MSKISDEVQNVRKIVVFFDICSSTTILEDLLRTENQKRWRNLLISLKKFLALAHNDIPFEVYKFLGDGWILLFDDSVSGSKLMNLLKLLCHEYEMQYKRKIEQVLAVDNHSIGLTFGIEAGTLVKMVMNGRVEYIGRALDIAARLQGAIKQKDKFPEGKLLISNSAYTTLSLSQDQKYTGIRVTRELRNIAGGERYKARKIILWKRNTKGQLG